ncbi:helix-turn-helix domain-containing protein [Cytophagales bacterium LB-30]|uniref:Helix-turn-helix domain-containing protein n=1 Tax=Shiella aurantiaca TaxID=3058365 RepID=A0ABT8F116_9BACT|nr:helix-turn-helix domain-containing protein [Shiella aurantiaca]MDN4164093.1 helix-turn-helix domain-containing protein [Shiella aurantiaca]
MDKELVHHVNLVLIFIEICFGLFLIIKSKFKSMPLLFLGLFITELSLAFISIVLFYKHLYYIYPHTLHVENFLVLSHAPLFYLFIGSLLEGRNFVSKRSLFHFIPALLSVILTLPFYLSSRSEKMKYVDAIYSSDHPILFLVISAVVFTQFIVYYVICFKMLIRFSYRLSEIENGTSETRIWVNSLIVVFYVCTAMSVFPGLLDYNEVSASYIPILSSPYFFFVFYSVIKKPHIFNLVSLHTEMIDSSDFLETERRTEDLSERYSEIGDRLHMEVIENKLFKDPELSLSKLSTLLDTKSHIITWILKNRYNENFYSYINSLRVEEAIRMLQDKNYNDYTIDYIGQLVGFNSKSVFYSAFKKYTGETPMRFLRNKQMVSN